MKDSLASPTSTSKDRDLITTNRSIFRKLFLSHTKSNRKSISFSDLANICKKVGLFPEFLNYKEIKIMISRVKKIPVLEVTSQAVTVDFEEFILFLRKSAEFYNLGWLQDSDRAMSKTYRNSGFGKKLKIKDLKKPENPGTMKEFISLIQPKVKFNYQLNLKLTVHHKNMTKFLKSDQKRKLCSPGSQSKFFKTRSKTDNFEAQNAPV